MPAVVSPKLNAAQPRVNETPRQAEVQELDSGLPEILHYAAAKAALGKTGRITHYNAEKAAFSKALEKWPEPYKTQLRDTLEAARFIDWAHMAPDIMETFRSRGRLSILERELQFLYNSTTTSRAPEFKNIQAVNKFLKECRDTPNLNRLRKVHSIAMAHRVEQLDRRELGKVRNYSVVGDETLKGISAVELKRVNTNPYLTFEQTNKIESKSRGDSRFFGYILYPAPNHIKQEALSRIEKSHPEVLAAIQEFQSLPAHVKKQHEDTRSARYRNLTRQLITALAEERYEEFSKNRKELGNLSTPKSVLDYIKLVALHYRDLISIHVMGNGNGRSLRQESLYDPLDKIGISRPRLNNPDADILFSPSGWLREVQRGILNTDALYRDVTQRLTLGLRVESSAELLFPNVVRNLKLDLRFRGKKREEKNRSFQSIDVGQFGAYVDTRFLVEPKLLRAFNKNPVAAMQLLRDEYKIFAKRTRVFCHIPGKGIEQVGLSLVDFDLRATFGVPLSGDKTAWDFKTRTWYGKNLVWRGLCFPEEAIGTQAALSIFKKSHAITVSNNLAGILGKDEKVFRKAQQIEFDRYNKDLLSGELRHLVFDHVRARARYDTSYGVSTSRMWGTAAGFAWGRGTFGYDNRKIAKVQNQIMSRLVIGALHGHKDVYVGRFKILDPQFSYDYGRQQEVLAVGGVDPDVVMVVQLLDKKRKIERSFVRNKDNPTEIWEVRGGIHPGSIPLNKIPKSEIIAKHRI